MNDSWHHGPKHVFVAGEIYMVTAGTLGKYHLFAGAERLSLLQNTLLETLDKLDWTVHAWAVFANHYHLIAKAPEAEDSLSTLTRRVHSKTAIDLNRLDGSIGRQVWFQSWDTCLSFEKSWLARLNYVHNNAVHHGLVRIAETYPYCSAAWFEQKANPSFRRKVQSFKYDKIKVVDEF